MSESESSKSSPNSRFGVVSIILMFVPFLAVALLSFVFVSSWSNTIQRIMMVLTLLLPALLGFLFAIIGLVKRENRKWIHIIALIFNLLESLYFGLLVSFAG